MESSTALLSVLYAESVHVEMIYDKFIVRGSVYY